MGTRQYNTNYRHTGIEKEKTLPLKFFIALLYTHYSVCLNGALEDLFFFFFLVKRGGVNCEATKHFPYPSTIIIKEKKF